MYKFDWKQLNSCWNYDINQLDGAVSVCSSLSDNSQCGDDTSQSDSICSSATDNNQSGDETSESDVSDVSWDEEAYSALIQAVLVPAPALPGAPPDLTVDTSGQARAPSCLPLAIVTNAWSLKMKMNMQTLLR